MLAIYMCYARAVNAHREARARRLIDFGAPVSISRRPMRLGQNRLVRRPCGHFRGGDRAGSLRRPARGASGARRGVDLAWPVGGRRARPTPPPGIDVRAGRLPAKVFFRIVNSEPSICGQAQASSPRPRRAAAVLQCHAVRGQARPGVHRLQVSESIGKRYRVAEPKKIDVAEAPMKGSASAKVTWSSSPTTVPALQAPAARAAPDRRRVPQRREGLLQALSAGAAHERAWRPRWPWRRTSRASSGRSRTSCGQAGRAVARRDRRSRRTAGSTWRASAPTWIRRRQGSRQKDRLDGVRWGSRRHAVHRRARVH